MAKRRFSKPAFRDWLDTLAKVCVKTRDNFTCQMGFDEECAGQMQPFDFNCQWCHIQSKNSYNWRWFSFNALTGCGHCHQWAHANPNQFGVWYAEKYPMRNVFLCFPLSNHTWREPDFTDMEHRLLRLATILNVDPLVVTEWHNYRRRYELRTANLKVSK